MSEELIIYCDAGARGNPGPAGIGVVICDLEGNVLREYGEYIGERTNNEAEYTAFLKALELAEELNEKKVKCFSDSQLVVRQLNSEYRINKESLRKLFTTVKNQEKAFKTVEYIYVERANEKIKAADKLANLAIERKSIVDKRVAKIAIGKDVEIEKIKEKIKRTPKNWYSHYKLGVAYFERGEYEEAEKSFKAALRVSSEPRYMPHFYKGRIFFEKGNYSKAKEEFEKVLEIKPDYDTAKWWLEQNEHTLAICERSLDHPETVEEIKEASKYRAIVNYAWLEWFEWNLRNFITKKLMEKYGIEEDRWWWEGVPGEVRGECAKKKEDALEEERSLSSLCFAEFSDYWKILDNNRDLFQPYFKNLKEWKSRLASLVKIRNAIAHSRSVIISEKRVSDLRQYCAELQMVLEKKERKITLI